MEQRNAKICAYYTCILNILNSLSGNNTKFTIGQLIVMLLIITYYVVNFEFIGWMFIQNLFTPLVRPKLTL